MKYSKDGLVCFDEDNHTYHLGDKKLLGVTSYISQFKNKFDSDKIAEAFARKNGLNKEEVLLKWKKEGEISAINGTACHSVIENYILNNEIKLLGISEKEKVAEKFIKDFFLTKRLIPVETEIIVYNDFLASQIDCIAKNDKGEYFILDWKTNKKIERSSYGKYMLGDYSIYPDANFFHYSLQLSIYKRLYVDNFISNAYIVHFDNSDYKFIPIENIKLNF